LGAEKEHGSVLDFNYFVAKIEPILATQERTEEPPSSATPAT